jgi:cobalt/nickel transport protein
MPVFPVDFRKMLTFTLRSASIVNFRKGEILKATLLKLGVLFFFFVIPARGHFQLLVPSNDIVEDPSDNVIEINCVFCHPFEGEVMNMVRPAEFGVVIRDGDKIDLLKTLSEYEIKGLSAWRADYTIGQPGDHVFYVVPKPYWEPAEETFIVHYTKVIVSGFGLESGWDAELGLKTEIVPLTRPYGLYAGNVFQGLVLVNGKPAPSTEVEVEYYNREGKYKAPATPYVTQVVKTDVNGVFSYAMPVAGWWGFAALNEAEEKMVNAVDGKSYPVEIGALIWIRTADMK